MTANPPTPLRDDAPESIWLAMRTYDGHVGLSHANLPEPNTTIRPKYVEYRRADQPARVVKPLVQSWIEGWRQCGCNDVGCRGRHEERNAVLDDVDETLVPSILAALLPTEAGAEPVGYALVPTDPTPTMFGAWYRIKNGHHFHGEPVPTDTSGYAAYRAMIAARPSATPPAPPTDNTAIISEIIEWCHNQRGSYPDWFDRARKAVGEFDGDAGRPKSRQPTDITALVEAMNAGFKAACDFDVAHPAVKALQAQVEGLTKENDRLAKAWEAKHDYQVKQSKSHAEYFDKSQRRMHELVAERDAALAREGAVAMEVREAAASECASLCHSYTPGRHEQYNAAIAAATRAIELMPIPTDAAAAQARREDEMIERVAAYMDHHGIGQVQDRDRIRALKRSKPAS